MGHAVDGVEQGLHGRALGTDRKLVIRQHVALAKAARLVAGDQVQFVFVAVARRGLSWRTLRELRQRVRDGIPGRLEIDVDVIVGAAARIVVE